MKTLDKFKFAILTIITFGWFYFHVKKMAKTGNTTRKVSSNKIRPDKLMEYLGGKDNIVSVQSSRSKVQINIKSKENVDAVALQGFPYVSGVLASSSYITLVVGEAMEKIAEIIKSQIN